ncbi:metal-dependent hydrolase [Nodosilinea sp. LEGE 07298]|nr:metal-dependent hydrolase [Nodosilinea sp. LEGE 07298]
MQARNHIPFAMSWWWLYCLGTDQPIEAVGTMAAAMGGLLPDIDHPKSALGRRIPFISIPLSYLVGHRGVTHSLMAVVVMLILLPLAAFTMDTRIALLVAPVCLGYLSHIAGDAMTPSGVPLLWPNRKRYTVNLFKTTSLMESVFVGVFTISVVILGDIALAVLESTVAKLPLLPVSDHHREYY